MLAEKYSKKIYDKIKDEIAALNCEEGGHNGGNLWKLTQNLNPQHSEPPVTMTDSKGNMLTSKENIQKNTVKYYQKLLENREIKGDLKDYRKDREELATQRMKLAEANKTPDWDMEYLDAVLKHIKKDKSRDALGYLNELFMQEVIGSDLKLALLKLMKNIKKQQVFPECLELCNITSIFKTKGKHREIAKSCPEKSHRFLSQFEFLSFVTI